MCNAILLDARWSDVRQHLHSLRVMTPRRDPSPQMAGTAGLAWVIEAGDGEGAAVARRMRWGIPMPSVGRTARRAVMHTTAEQASTCDTLGRAWDHRRCLIPASAYTCRRDLGAPTSTVRPADGGLLLLAGIWVPARSAHEPARFALLVDDLGAALPGFDAVRPLVVCASVIRDWLYGDGAEALAIAAYAAQPPLVVTGSAATATGMANVHAAGAAVAA